mgnify:CR=1 FL=1|tara:strand:+ start:6411 stop:6674 length:264 start_codon:yes stop_codon:yes gene_type:complete
MISEKPSFGNSKKVSSGDLVQWRHWDNGWVDLIGVVTSINTTRMAGRRIVMVRVTTTTSSTDRVKVGQEIELSPLSLKILSTNTISE